MEGGDGIGEFSLGGVKKGLFLVIRGGIVDMEGVHFLLHPALV